MNTQILLFLEEVRQGYPAVMEEIILCSKWILKILWIIFLLLSPLGFLGDWKWIAPVWGFVIWTYLIRRLNHWQIKREDDFVPSDEKWQKELATASAWAVAIGLLVVVLIAAMILVH